MLISALGSWVNVGAEGSAELQMFVKNKERAGRGGGTNRLMESENISKQIDDI